MPYAVQGLRLYSLTNARHGSERSVFASRVQQDFAEYVSHIAAATATSHTRGTASKSPGQFKEVITAAFAAPYARTTWGVAVAKVAAQYRQQVLLDFECFRDYVNEHHAAAAVVLDEASSSATMQEQTPRTGGAA